MARHLRLNAWPNNTANYSGMQYQEFCTTLEETDNFEDIFMPGFWRHYSSGPHALHENDVVRLIAADRSYDIYVTVDKIVPGGANSSFSHGRLPKKYHGMHAEEIANLLTKNEADFEVCKLDQNGKPIPRAEQLPTGWRVIGNENEVVEHSLKAKRAADDRLDKYMRDLALRFPSPAEAAEHAQTIIARQVEASQATAKKHISHKHTGPAAKAPAHAEA